LRHSVSVLARTSEPAGEIDLERAERARQSAEATLGDLAKPPDTLQRAEIKLKRALSRIQVYRRLQG